MKDFWTACVSEILSWPGNMLFLWLLLIAPCLGMTVLTGVFGSGMFRNLQLAVCDMDNSPISRLFLRKVDALPSTGKLISVQSAAEAYEKIQQSIVAGCVLVPPHFEHDILRGNGAKPVIYIDGQHMPVGGVLRRDLTEAGSAFWRELLISDLELKKIPPRASANIAGGISLDLRSPGNPSINYKLFLSHAFLPIMMQIVSAVYASCSFFRSREEHSSYGTMLGRIFPAALWTWFMYCIIAACQTACGNALMHCSFFTLCGLWLLHVLACICMALFISGLCDHLLEGLMFVSAMSSPAFAFSGVTFPISSMPLFGKFWSGLLPSTHVLKLETALSQMGAAPQSLLLSFLSLSILIIFFCIGGIVMHNIRRMKSL